MAGMGPTPKPNARRHRGTFQSAILPAGGCHLPPPPWPLSQPTHRELELWRDLWRLPQATIWHQVGWPVEPAFYIQHLVRAEDGDLNASAEMRMLSDRLGVNPLAMLWLRWTLAEPVVPSPVTPLASAAAVRRRIQAVDPDDLGAS